jgi:processing peptidase subunit alpha
LHSAGYVGALGQPLLAPESSLGRLNGGVLHNFVKDNYTAPRIVLAGKVTVLLNWLNDFHL